MGIRILHGDVLVRAKGGVRPGLWTNGIPSSSMVLLVPFVRVRSLSRRLVAIEPVGTINDRERVGSAKRFFSFIWERSSSESDNILEGRSAPLGAANAHQREPLGILSVVPNDGRFVVVPPAKGPK
jgi:hypothetical protein